MLDDVKDFVKSITERLSSPLFGSFVIAWLLINYHIPIAILFYKREDLSADRYSTINHLIDSHNKWQYFIAYPALFAILYVFISPAIRNGIAVLNAYIDAKGSGFIMRYSKGQKVDISKFIALRQEWANSRERLETLYEQESGNIQRIAELTANMDQKEVVIKDLQSSAEHVTMPFYENYFNGKWKLGIVTRTNVDFNFDVEIQGDTWSVKVPDKNLSYRLIVKNRAISLMPQPSITLHFAKISSVDSEYEILLFRYLTFVRKNDATQSVYKGVTDIDHRVELKKVEEWVS